MTASLSPHRVASPTDLTEDAALAFRQRGFLAIDRLIDDGVLAQLRSAYDDVIDGKRAAVGDRHLGGVIRQVKDPSTAHPLFADNPAIDVGIRIAATVFGHDRFARFYEMLIDKPAGTVHETPWHQDLGYFGKPVASEGTPGGLEDIQVWVALDDVDVDNGCMQFVPRAFGEPAVAHVVVSGDPNDEGRLIAVADVGALGVDNAVACPLPAGGCTMHFVSTPHYTGPNLTTDRRRRAYIFNIGPAGLGAQVAKQFEREWNREFNNGAV
jgi:hypothetical protein